MSVNVNNPTGTAGLVAAYGFEEASGTTTADQTGLGHTGTLSGPTRSTLGKFGRALSFDGVNDWVTVADANDLDVTTTMTVEAWVFPTATTNAWRTTLAKEQSSGLSYAMMANSSSGRPFGVIDTGGEQLAQGPAGLPVNAWSHLTATYDGSALRLYVNGTLVTTTPAIGSIIASGSPLRFGGNSGLGEWFQGRLDDIRIYNRTLSASEIQTDMNTPAGQPAPTDTTPPSAPGNLTATGQLGGVRLNWSASTDNVGVTEYRVHRSTTTGFTPSAANLVASVAGSTTTYTDSGLAAGTYHYVVVAADAAGNTASSAQASGTALADTTAPTVSLTSPTAGATVSGVVSVAATASDDVGVQSVQFKLDGANLGAPDTTAPYSFSWDTRTTSTAPHSLTAVAVDAAGNQTTSTAVSVSVNNPTGTAGLVAAYGFEEASGTTTADQTGLGHTGTLSGPTRSTLGKFGRALSFDGVNDWVTVADANDLDVTTTMTVEAWVFPTTSNNVWRTAVAKELGSGLSYAMMARSSAGGRPYGVISTPNEQLAQGSAALAVNTWSHLSATYDGSALRLYVNGTLVATTPAIGSIAISGSPLRFGGNSGLGEWFQGRLDDIRIYNRTLSASEIQTDMNAPAG